MNKSRYVFLIALIILASCGKSNSGKDISLYSTSILTEKLHWAVCSSTHLRIRELPEKDAPILKTVWKGAVVKVSARGLQNDTIEGKTDYWYKVSANQISGWAFGSFLTFFNSQESADEAANEADREL